MPQSAATEFEGLATPGTAGRTAAVSHLPALKPAELSFLLGILRLATDGAAPSFPANGNAALLWEYIERHGLGGVLGAEPERVIGLPSVLAEAARHRYWSNCLHAAQARERCAAVLAIAKREGLTVFLVKGPALADLGYADDGWRGFSDLDFFTASPEAARRLAEACGARVLVDSERQGLAGEIWDSGRVLADLDGWSIEIRFPMAGWSGPLFELFPNGEWPEVVRTPSGLLAPNPEWHFLFLLYHLLLHHWFGRLVWFLDLAVLVRRQRACLDWGRVQAECERLAMREALAAAASFCRRYADPEFPEARWPRQAPWNRRFLRHLADPRVVVSSGQNKQHVSRARLAWAVIHGAAVYFLLTDPPAHGRSRHGRGRHWTQARIQCVLAHRWRGRWGRWLGRRVSGLIAWLLYPVARLLAWIPAKPEAL